MMMRDDTFNRYLRKAVDEICNQGLLNDIPGMPGEDEKATRKQVLAILRKHLNPRSIPARRERSQRRRNRQ